MKKLFITMLGVVGLLCSTSCSDEAIVSNVEGDAMVEFTVELSDGVDASRAISDGLTVEDLYCEVYSMADPENPQRLYDLDQEVIGMGTKMTTIDGVEMEVRTATIRMALVKGQAYNVLFWAQAPGAYNLIDEETGKTDLRNITVAPATANTESKDAFTAVYKTEKVTGPINATIVLRRPFAQINFGTTMQDYEDALKAGIDFAAASKVIEGTLASKIVASHGATTYDALTETSTDDGQGLTFGWASVKDMVENQVLNVGGVGYKYLATAYMLVPGGYESNTSDITMEIETGLNENISLLVPFAPVQRNYRTNVLGNLLTNTADFTVIVDPNYYKPDNNIEVDQTQTVSTAAELQAAIDAAIVGNNVITFGANIAGDIIVPQNEGINIVINGAGYEFDGTFDIYGKARFQGAETLTFNEIDFVHADGAIDFITCNTTVSEKRYAHNVTVSNCTFTGNANGDVLGMRYRQCYNMTVLNSTFTDMHSIMWATGGGGNGVTIDGVTAVNCKNGASFGTTNNVVVKNSNIATVGEYGYGLRADASGAYKMTVENTAINAAAPILARKATGAYTLALEGINPLHTTAAYQIIITNSDYDAGKVLEAPTGAYTLTGAEGYVVYPDAGAYHAASGLFYNGNDKNWQSVFYLNNASDLAKAAAYFVHQTNTSEANGVTFELKADIDLAGVNWTPWTVMWITLNGNGHKISNVNVAGGWRGGLFGYLGAAKVNDLTIENVNIVGAQAGLLAGSAEGVTTSNVKIAGTNSVTYGVDATETWGGIGAVTGVLTNSTINAEIVEGATVELDYNGIVSQAPYVDTLTGYLQANSGTVVNNGTVKVVAATSAGLNAALKNTGIQDIYLKAGEFTADIYSIPERETLNIVGTEGTKLAFANLQVRASQFKEFTVSNCEILRMPNKAWGMLVFGSGNKADGVYTISNCTFNGVGTQGVYINENVSGATYNVLNCTFNGDFGGEGAITIQNNTDVNHTVNVQGCTFNNVPETSHNIYILGAYNGWTLNTDESNVVWSPTPNPNI